MPPELDPTILLRAYAMGIFPMAEARDDPEIHWIDPRMRGIFPLDGFHISRSLARLIRRWPVEVRVNTAFAEVVDACAAREETWINPPIRSAYLELHRLGHAHSLEVWDGAELAGGVYGVTLGAGFFGESMFSAQTGGSKVALAYLIHRLRAGGFQLFDTQFLTPHLASLGAVEIPRTQYRRRLAEVIEKAACFEPEGYSASASSLLSGLSSASGGA
ncbi:leucyl/phenylalanyl-tRNA--protein transferase [Xinfangfangia sp. CPCC 101601]|uniref:Leucyl/phenylalanyl-tRNA--protein transferase n=1 Tax=Pseudogemmobacter lacusdianii TaxID=3069608 RepID=A0ABU0VYF4_9RHOB|nr:leucyl/phenylalanyl-tRNA--protein transferase [Xinfangfangia sp. CPCC 101601]MDQ2066787.1 leucyl/phenylalanyl-tRNA--protein transferase [Xinfangfangia sp. CPCC 101601]